MLTYFSHDKKDNLGFLTTKSDGIIYILFNQQKNNSEKCPWWAKGLNASVVLRRNMLVFCFCFFVV